VAAGNEQGIGSYDIVVLGGGSGGYACALRAAELGKRVALIEKDKVGGTCLHRGCIPTKALLHAAEIADQARESAKFGVKTAFEGIDVPGVQKYKTSVVDRLWRGLQSEDRHHRRLGPARVPDLGQGRRHRLRSGARGAGHRVRAP
jgi:pyruvate/2-oxoglutarate dehydrogenase complex dihydrolipoamide dehydrogenase (E3) component